MNHEQLEQEVKRLQKEVEELKKAHQANQTTWHKTLMQVVFYGAVASGLTSIANLIIAVINLVKKN
ncbi:MAG: Cell cycle protein GpsB [Mycoplasmataceae bacterium]|nr:MAG: Cell cycle protein GpsB [Mycoplasmataceae bacterium]